MARPIFWPEPVISAVRPASGPVGSVTVGLPSGRVSCSALFRLRFEAARRDVAEQREMRVLREPRRTDAIADEHDGGSARPIIRRAVLAIAGGVEDAHADSLQPVRGDDGAYVRAETELVYV